MIPWSGASREWNIELHGLRAPDGLIGRMSKSWPSGFTSKGAAQYGFPAYEDQPL